MKIVFGLCTYNRKEILEQSIQSLMNVNDIKECGIVVFDDCSTEYSGDYLAELIPNAQVFINSRNMKADANTAQLFKWFVQSEYDVLVCADSDLIWMSDVVSYVQSMIEIHQFFSLFNTKNHAIESEYSEDFVVKQDVGSAGCVLSKDVARKIVANIKYVDTGFDCTFSHFLKRGGSRY